MLKIATSKKLVQEATTETGIYRDHLRGHLVTFGRYPNLAATYKKVITSAEPVNLDSIAAYELERMGLVKLKGNQVFPRCELYRLYFCARL